MSILAKLRAENTSSRPYILVMGKSSAGKTTLAGTLPGKTLLISVRGKEFGAASAAAKAAERGNSLVSVYAGSISELLALADELRTDTDFENVVVDGYTALTFLSADDPEIAKVLEGKTGNVFAAYDKIRNDIAKIHKAFADLTYAATAKKPKVVCFTLAVDTKTDASGSAIEMVPVLKGKASLAEFTRPAPTIVSLAARQTENGLERIMLTSNASHYVARVNGILDEVNPKVIEPDLSKLLSLMETK